MTSENFLAGVVCVKIRAVEANQSYRLYATIGDAPLVPVCYVDKKVADSYLQGPESFCEREAETHIRAALQKYVAETDG